MNIIKILDFVWKSATAMQSIAIQVYNAIVGNQTAIDVLNLSNSNVV